MARNLVEISTFTPHVTVPENGEPARRETEDVPFQALANRTKFLNDARMAHDARITALEGHVRPDLVERTLFIGPKGMPDWDAIDGRPEWEPHSTALGARNAMKSRMPGDGERARISWDLYPGNELPTRCTVTRVRAWVTPGAAYTGGDTMVLSVYRIIGTGTGGSPSLAGQGTTADGMTAFHAINTGTISVELVAENIDVYPPGASLGLSVVLTGGNGANDLVHWLEVRYTREGI